MTCSDRSKQSGEELIRLLVFNILHQLVGAGQAAMQNTDYLVSMCEFMCVCAETIHFLLSLCFGLLKTDCTVCICVFITLCVCKKGQVK